MILKEDKYVKGNVVIAPKREVDIERHKKESKDLQKINRERTKKMLAKQRIIKKSTLGIVALVFVSGCIVVWRHAVAFNTQKELSSLKLEVSKIRTENDNIKVDLLKGANLQYIKESAEGKLGMVAPNRNDVIRVDLNKNNFNEPQTNSKKKENILNMLKDLFF